MRFGIERWTTAGRRSTLAIAMTAVTSSIGLDTIAAQLMDADRRHTAALSEMQERITGMSREADRGCVRAFPKSLRLPCPDRDCDGRARVASPARAMTKIIEATCKRFFDRRAVQSLDAHGASFGKSTCTADRRERDEGPTRHARRRRIQDVIGFVPGDASDAVGIASGPRPWLVCSGPGVLPSFTSAAGARERCQSAWLESRFAEIASGIEHSLAAARPDNGLSEISQRLDQFERQFAKLFAGSRRMTTSQPLA